MRVSEASFAELKPFVGAAGARRIVEHFAHLRASDVISADGAQVEG